MVTFITLLLVVLLPIFTSRLRQENRGGLQQTLEVAYESIRGLVRNEVHSHPERHYHMMAVFGLVVIFFNMAGAFPLMTTPTPFLNTTVALALTSFVYYNVQGIREHGPVGYAKTLMGPIALLAPIMFLSELISHLARILSLSLRLSASVSAEHVVVGAFMMIFPYVLPATMVTLGLILGFLQTFIFVLLSTVYVGQAVSEEH
jgi:F-type H+-transporting ATPase subunit a